MRFPLLAGVLLQDHAGKDISHFFSRDAVNADDEDIMHFHSRQAMALVKKMRVAVLVVLPVAGVNAVPAAETTVSNPTAGESVFSKVHHIPEASESASAAVPMVLPPVAAPKRKAPLTELRCVDVVEEDADGTVKTCKSGGM